MPTIVNRGSLSAQGYGFASLEEGAAAATYVEDVFSTYVYTGTGATQTITNGIDLATKGGLVWIKSRSDAVDNVVYDTARGVSTELRTNSTAAETTEVTGLTAFNTTGFTIGNRARLNSNGATFAAWTFRKQAKFFDIVTYTGDGTNPRTIAHNLGSTPGCIIVKRRTGATADWPVYHRSRTSSNTMDLNLNANEVAGGQFTTTAPTSSSFTVSASADINASGAPYVAYLFAHDAGGFGAAGTDNIVSCDVYTGNGNSVGPIVTLGWEPQWLMVKKRTGTNSGDWVVFDNMRGLSAGLIASSTHSMELHANDALAEQSRGAVIPQPTGFQIYGSSATGENYNTLNEAYIYVAIRRGPMRVPTSGSKVLELVARTGTGANALVPATNITDFVFIKNRGYTPSSQVIANRITNNGFMTSPATTAETASTATLQANPWDVIGGVKVGTTAVNTNFSTGSFINYLFTRAPQCFDVLSYIFPASFPASNGEIRIPHNLTVPPEMIIAKSRTGALGWYVYHKEMGIGPYVRLNTTNTLVTPTGGTWGASDPSATDFGVTPASIVATSATASFHLFATCPGVTKVGSYVGTTATAKQIDCGFTTGARFVLIKRMNGAAGDWYLWDTTRGIVASNDPYYLVNTTGEEVTTTDYIDFYGAGFELTAAAPAALNTTGSTFIFLAIA